MKNFYISHDPKLCDMVEDSYATPKDTIGVEITRKNLDVDQKK